MPARSPVASPPTATTRPPRYEGVLQGIGNGVALGWVLDRADPAARVGVSVVVDGEVVAEGRAEVARPDLAELGLGDSGAHGFMVALPERLQTPARHRILVLAGPERVPLPAAPSFWHKPSLDGTWSDVVFEPGGALSAPVPDPPAPRERRALVARGWLCDAEELVARGPVGEERLERIAAALARAGDACAALGIAYVPALLPRKRDALAGPPAGEREWVAALGTRLRDADHVELLDLLPVLRDAARHGLVYNRTDADWNDRGAFFAARALLKEAHKRVPALHPPAPTDLRLRHVPSYRGTLADAPTVRLLGGELVPCAWDVEAEHAVAIDPSGLHALRMPVERDLADAGAVHLRVYAGPVQDEHARLAVLGDAAAVALLPWLAEHTARTTFFWTSDLPLDQLELELPPVVLHLLREVDLHSGRLPEVLEGPPPAPPALAQRGGASSNGHPPVLSAPAGGAGALRGPREDLPGGAAPGVGAAASTSLAAVAGASAARAVAALRANVWTIALVALLTAFTWPFAHVVGGSGLDNSWVVGLYLAVAHGLAFGTHVVFTYGPLGFAYVPTAVTPGTFRLAELLGGLVQLALVAALLANTRRWVGLPGAVLLTLLAASLLGRLEAQPLSAIAFGLLALTLAAPASRSRHAFRRLALAGGTLAGFALLVKLNDGVAVSAIVAVGLLGGGRRRRDLAVAAGCALGTLLVLWLAVGEPLGALPAYLRNGYEVIGGYVEAMGDNRIGVQGEWQVWLVLGSALALGFGAWRALATAPLRRRAALSGAVVLLHYFLAREMFVRYDAGHVGFLALLPAVALMIPWTRAQRSTALALAGLLAVGAFAVLHRSMTVGEVVNPLGNARQFLAQARDALHPGALIAEGRGHARRDLGIPRSISRTLRGHCVAVEPDEIAAVWAYPRWRWCPLPVFQSYSAYTSRLDRLNAAAYADARHGPDRVLRQVDEAIDERNPIWESPAAMLALLCHFTELGQSGEWQVLGRVPNRCGAPRTFAVIHGSLDRAVALPPPPEGAVMVAAVEGVQVAGWERLQTLFTRAAPRYVTVNQNPLLQFRVPPGVAADGLVLWVPPYADYAAPFNLNMNPHTLVVDVHGHHSGAVTVRVMAIPIAGAGHGGEAASPQPGRAGEAASPGPGHASAAALPPPPPRARTPTRGSPRGSAAGRAAGSRR
jgi:hypothetical protein